MRRIVASLLVDGTKGTETREAKDTDAPTQKTKPTPRTNSAARDRHGGWQSSPRLTWSEVKEIDDVIRELVRLRVRPTHLVTVMSPSGTDSERKRFCGRTFAHLGQSLKRHSKPHIGLTIFENSADADLHAHHLVHVPREERHTVERFHNPPLITVTPIRNLVGLVGYLTKQRQRLPPDFEKKINRPWQRCQPVPGKRWTTTAAASAALVGSSSNW